MATRGEASVHSPSVRRIMKPNGQQKREDLEREVSMLQNMLDREEKVNQILELALNRHDSSVIQIPSFLPHKTKELLAELTMVENEITRLETEISHLKSGLSHEKQEITYKESKSIQWQSGTQSNNNPRRHSSPQRYPTPIPKRIPERQAFDTKALHFISKAIKGDYALDSYFSNNENMSISSKVIADHQKGSYANGENGLEDHKVSRKSGIQKPTSPTLFSRQSTSKPVEHDQAKDLPPKSLLPNSSSSEETDQKWQPNKLSESIMKCLIFIFVRLIRTSKSMELEKSTAGAIKSNNSSLSSRSFRADISLSSKPNPSLQKGSRQQDPYGIFDIEESIPRDIGPYKNFVRFTSTSLDPKNISSSSSLPLLQKLRVLMNNLSNVDLRLLTYQQKLAFWINMYNACIMHGFLQYGVPSSQEKLLTLMNKATLNIGGNKINALAIERFILRHRSNSNLNDVYRKGAIDDKEATVRSIYGLESPEPNVTFALCCGTRSSPAVRIYTAEGISAELEKSKLEYLQASIVVTNTKKVLLPELLLRNMIDFANNFNSLVEWIYQQLPASGSLRKSMVECLRGHNISKLSNSIDKMAYEFEFQYLLAI